METAPNAAPVAAPEIDPEFVAALESALVKLAPTPEVVTTNPDGSPLGLVGDTPPESATRSGIAAPDETGAELGIRRAARAAADPATLADRMVARLDGAGFDRLDVSRFSGAIRAALSNRERAAYFRPEGQRGDAVMPASLAANVVPAIKATALVMGATVGVVVSPTGPTGQRALPGAAFVKVYATTPRGSVSSRLTDAAARLRALRASTTAK